MRKGRNAGNDETGRRIIARFAAAFDEALP